MKTKLFGGKRTIPVDVTVEQFTDMRILCMKHGITIIDLFKEFSEQILKSKGPAIAILDAVVAKRALASLEHATGRVIDAGPDEKFSERDAEMIYNMLDMQIKKGERIK